MLVTRLVNVIAAAAAFFIYLNTTFVTHHVYVALLVTYVKINQWLHVNALSIDIVHHSIFTVFTMWEIKWEIEKEWNVNKILMCFWLLYVAFWIYLQMYTILFSFLLISFSFEARICKCAHHTSKAKQNKKYLLNLCDLINILRVLSRTQCCLSIFSHITYDIFCDVIS